MMMPTPDRTGGRLLVRFQRLSESLRPSQRTPERVLFVCELTDNVFRDDHRVVDDDSKVNEPPPAKALFRSRASATSRNVSPSESRRIGEA